MRKTFSLIFACNIIFSWAEARFDYVTNENGEWIISTQSKKAEGLGAIIRDLGLQPNWQDRSWISAISAYNPGKIDGQGKIINAGDSIQFPLDSLSGCSGYDALVSRLGPARPPELPPAPTVQEPVVDEPLMEPAPEEPEGPPTKYSLMATLGGGAYNLYGEESLGADADQFSEFYGRLNLDLYVHINEFADFIIFGQAEFIDLAVLDNITTTIEKEFYASGGIELNFRMAEVFRMGFFGGYGEKPRANFNITDYETLAVPFFTGGISFGLRLLSWQESAVFVKLHPYIILSADKNDLDMDSGFGSRIRLEWTPKIFQDQSGWVIGAEYMYEAQSATHNRLSNTSDQKVNAGTGYVGYLF